MRREGLCLLAVACALLAPAAAEARPPDKPAPSAPDKNPPNPNKPPKGGGSASTDWLDTADAVCDQGLRERQALLTDVSRSPSSTARKTLLRILTGTDLVEERMLRGLSKVRPQREERAAFDGALRLFRDRHAENERLIASLRRKWNARRLENQARRDRVLNGRLALLWSDLGAGACVRYFDSLGG